MLGFIWAFSQAGTLVEMAETNPDIVVVSQDMGMVVNPQGSIIQAEGCVTMGLGYALAEDVAQEAFVRAFRAIRRFDLRQRFYPWFYRIVKNCSLTALKRRRGGELSLDAENAPAVERIFARIRPRTAAHIFGLIGQSPLCTIRVSSFSNRCNVFTMRS